MGSGFCCVPLGPKSSDDKHKALSPKNVSLKSASSSHSYSSSPGGSTIACIEHGRIGLQSGCSFGQPLLLQNEILYVSSRKNTIIITRYNIKTRKYSDISEFECPSSSKKPFNIHQSQYTLDPKQKIIYFINNDQEIMTLDLNTKTIAICGDVNIPNGNKAQIQRIKNKIYILGAEEKSNNDNIIHIPYDAFKNKGAGSKLELMENYGSLCTTVAVTIKKHNYIFILGGQKEHSKGVIAPNDEIWILNVDHMDKNGVVGSLLTDDKKWMKRFLYLSSQSFGVINYKNKYLYIFGGFQYYKKRNEFRLSDKIYVLELSTGKWYQLAETLPDQCGYFVCYPENGKVVHLFSWRGKYYTISINDLVKPMDNGQGIDCSREWIDQGKTVMPTKSFVLQNMGPKIEFDEEEEQQDDQKDDK